MKRTTRGGRLAPWPPGDMTLRSCSFISDFGHSDWFVGVVHGVVLEICPRARIVDLTTTSRPASSSAPRS
jgi:hypothetical protein